MDERQDVVYAERESGPLELDLYLPADDGPHPLVVWIHGGAWMEGDRTWMDELARGLPDRGYALASVSYRLTDVATFPAQIEDCRAAVRWLRAHADEYDLDPDRVSAWGPSAGGHLVALLGTAPDATFDSVERTVNPDASHAVDAVIDFYGPSDLRAMAEDPSDIDHGASASPEGRLIGGAVRDNPEEAAAASPVTYVDGSEPPFLVAHGSADRVVPPEQSERLVSALREADDEVTYHVVPGAGHVELEDEAVADLVTWFLERHLG